MEQIVFYKRGEVWVYTDGYTTAEKTAPAGHFRRVIDGTKIAIYGQNNWFSLFYPVFVEVTEIQRSPTPGDNYVDIADFIGATDAFFVSASGSGARYIGGQVPTYADLPDPALHPGEFWLVEQGSGIYLINRKPAGLYYSNGVSWASAPNIVPYFSDANFRIFDDVDNSKNLAFNVDQIQSGSVRTWSWPNTDGKITVFGNEYQIVYEKSETNTTSSVYQQKVRLTTPIIPAGTYRVNVFYNHSSDDENQPKLFRLQHNDSLTLFEESPVQKKKIDDGAYYSSYGFSDVLLTSGIHFFDLDYANFDGKTTYIKNAIIEFWRVS